MAKWLEHSIWILTTKAALVGEKTVLYTHIMNYSLYSFRPSILAKNTNWIFGGNSLSSEKNVYHLVSCRVDEINWIKF